MNVNPRSNMDATIENLFHIFDSPRLVGFELEMIRMAKMEASSQNHPVRGTLVENIWMPNEHMAATMRQISRGKRNLIFRITAMPIKINISTKAGCISMIATMCPSDKVLFSDTELSLIQKLGAHTRNDSPIIRPIVRNRLFRVRVLGKKIRQAENPAISGTLNPSCHAPVNIPKSRNTMG